LVPSAIPCVETALSECGRKEIEKACSVQTYDLSVHRLGFGEVAVRELQRSIPSEAPVSN